jgi:uracil-DNA glycosylase
MRRVNGPPAVAANRLLRPLDELLERCAGAGDGWAALLQRWRRSADGRALVEAVDRRVAAGETVYPAAVFRALELTPLHAVRVVILGQDPYHGPGQADGLAFSVPHGVRLPPSLRNILAERARDLGTPTGRGGDLAGWARGGVLLLNTSLTVADGQPGAHAKLGWQVLADQVVDELARDPVPKVFLLWGGHAQRQAVRLTAAAGSPRHLVLQSNHPSPLSARRPPVPFMGCGHFSKAQRFLAKSDVPWQWPD